MTTSERVTNLEAAINELGAALGRIEGNLDTLKRGIDNYTECVLTPVLSSLDNRLIEAHKLWRGTNWTNREADR